MALPPCTAVNLLGTILYKSALPLMCLLHSTVTPLVYNADSTNNINTDHLITN